jgi:uncharacterized protein YozE (UPF0346 family)
MTFYEFVIQYDKISKGENDLKTDMLVDENFPRQSFSRSGIRKYLERCGAAEPCIDVFESLFEAYIESRDNAVNPPK